MTKAMVGLVRCQVRSETESPCTNRAVVEIRGIAFCEACAREQEAYFAIGEITQEETRGLRSKQLVMALERMRRERSGSREGAAAAMHRAPGRKRDRAARDYEKLTSEGTGTGLTHELQAHL